MTFDARGRHTGSGSGSSGGSSNENSNAPATSTSGVGVGSSGSNSGAPPTEQLPPLSSNLDSSSESSAASAESITPEKLISSFPTAKLRSLTQKISSPRWVVPVLPEQELEVLLKASIALAEAGVDHLCEPCMDFFRNGMTTSFSKILTDEAVNSWKYNIHHCILMSCGKLLHLIAIHMLRDNPFLLDLLAMALDPENKFNTYNASRQPECFVAPNGPWGVLDANKMFAKPPTEPKNPRGWLVDMINCFGYHGGFDKLLERFNIGLDLLKKSKDQESETSSSSTADVVSSSSGSGSKITRSPNVTEDGQAASNRLTLALIYSFLRPFGQCYELLTPSTISKYFMPIWTVVLEMFSKFSDDDLKRESKPEGRNDYINGIVRASRYLASRLPGQEEVIRELEMFRLKMILRLLQVSSFNGKMNALNEINKVLTSVSYYSHRTQQLPHCMSDDDMDWLTAERMARWIKESDVLGIVLKDSLHQPQYVEKLEKIIRFLIKEHALTLQDLDAVWRAQSGKHEAIVKNVHDLLAKLAWDFTPEQLDHLFECFQASMTTANKRQRERLLELIRRLAEDDKNGVMAEKVLRLFWMLAHSQEIPPEVLDQALAAHVKILDYSCSQERDAQKVVWLDKCVMELKSNDTWALPALRLIREICCLYESSANHAPRSQQSLNRQQVIERLQNDYSLVILVTNSLCSYMDKVRAAVLNMNQRVEPSVLCIDGRYPHILQIQERLDFLKFLLKDGQLWLCADQAKQIWHCLAVTSVFQTDREECFRWFGKLMGEEPDLDPGINKDFFENNILQLDPQLLTESGIKCFERFFKAVNSKVEKLKAVHRGYTLDNEDLIGKDYLWRVITTAGEEIADKAIDLLKEVSTALSPRLQEKICEFHKMFIDECCERLRTHYTNIMALGRSEIADPNNYQNVDGSKDNEMRLIEAEKMCRILKVMQEYIRECDRSFNGDRFLLPLGRCSRGKHVSLYIRFQNAGRPIEDIEITTHNNETFASFKRNLLKRIKGASVANIKVDLYYNNGEAIEITDEINPLSHYTIRDKMIITAKITQIGTGLVSSPDSSSDSSTGSPLRPCPDMQRVESESTLPGVIISQNYQYTEFFLKLYQMGSDLEHGKLRESAKALLNLLPCDRQTMKMLRIMCRAPEPICSSKDDGLDTPVDPDVAPAIEQLNPQDCTPEKLFLHPSPAQVLYNLSVLNGLLIPALDPLGESALQIQLAWLHSGCAHFNLELLTKNNFLPNADMHTKRASFQCVLRLAKFLLYVMGSVLSRVGDEPNVCDYESSSRSRVEILKQILTSFPNNSETTMRLIASKLAELLSTEMLTAHEEGARCRALFETTLHWRCPDISTIKAVVQLAWASSCGNLQALGAKNDFADDLTAGDSQDMLLCKEALEVLTNSLVLNPSANEAITIDPIWPKYVTSLLLKNPSRHVRQMAAEQLFLMCTYCAGDRHSFTYVVNLLVSSLKTLVPQYESSCADFFQLLCRTLSYGCVCNWPLNFGDGLLTVEIKWLQKIRENVTSTGDIQVHEELLEGHLCLTKELMFFLTPETKAQLNDLIHELINDFIFPASRECLHLRRFGKLSIETAPPPVCRTANTIAAGCDLLTALSQNCVPNMKLLSNTLVDFVCSDPLREWDYLPPVGARPPKGFCGLKNAGATCYMNSVLQQLYMVPAVRVGILKAEGAITNENEDFSGELDSSYSPFPLFGNQEESNEGRSKGYHVVILKHVQAIFAHLGHSALQYYVPRGLWTHFKLQGEPVNLREQQDAVEFFMSLFESLDEGLKALGYPQLMNATLGGSFSDQKICQGCPHRYSKEEPFSVFSVDIRNHSSLTESLEQYVKGELLEGADAYHCDKCDKKVDTVKRLCVKKLPRVLAIQLKRFEYDYERVCAIKFNDYFEFPRTLDMEPYTVSGLAKLEGEVIEMGDNCQTDCETTRYELTGIVVHSGQASGGHYFSYILSKNPSTGKEQWYKFDDGEVTECKMHEDEEMKAQCFGGDYMGEIYDNNLKRMQYRRQKRWWNAYMLFYTRCDQKPVLFEETVEQLSLAESRNFVLPMPKAIERSVRNQNIRFLHSKSIFSVEFFNFIKKLVSCNIPSTRSEKMSEAAEELSLLGVQLASQFLFHTGFRTKKTLRGPVIEWYDTLSHHIRLSSVVRRWFAEKALLTPPTRLGEYILMAPSPEVRTVFVKLVVFFCHFAINDDPLPNHEGSNLCEQILISVLRLLKGEVSDHGKHLPHYFSLFSMYVGLGIPEKLQLIKLNVPVIFMQVALDEGPGPCIKYQYPELSKLHQVVSQLVRCCDVSDKCHRSSGNDRSNDRPLPNPFKDPSISYEDLQPLHPDCSEILFSRTNYIKKLIEDTSVGEEGFKLLQYCSWENPQFSRAVLAELLWQCGFAYCHDMRFHTDLLFHILLIEDSWQQHRIHNALNGMPEEREGLLDTILRAKVHYQKRAYQIIKCLTQLFHKSPVALAILNSNAHIAKQWSDAVEWLQDELERQRGIGCQYNSYSWSPPAQSNDTTNGYMLERSQSAKTTWTLAYALCAEEGQEEANEFDNEIDEPQRQLLSQSQSQLQSQSQSQPIELAEDVPPSSPIHKATSVSIGGVGSHGGKAWKLNALGNIDKNQSGGSETTTSGTQSANDSNSSGSIGGGGGVGSGHNTRAPFVYSDIVGLPESETQSDSNINGINSGLSQMIVSSKTSLNSDASEDTKETANIANEYNKATIITTTSSQQQLTNTTTTEGSFIKKVYKKSSSISTTNPITTTTFFAKDTLATATTTMLSTTSSSPTPVTATITSSGNIGTTTIGTAASLPMTLINSMSKIKFETTATTTSLTNPTAKISKTSTTSSSSSTLSSISPSSSTTSRKTKSIMSINDEQQHKEEEEH